MIQKNENRFNSITVEKAYFNHHPKFDIDEDSLLVAAKSVGQVVCSYFEQQNDFQLEKTAEMI